MHPEKMNIQEKESLTIGSLEDKTLQLKESRKLNVIYKQRIDAYHKQLCELQDENKKTLFKLEQCEQHLYAVTHSKSWKITAPIRIINYFIRSVLPISFIKSLVKKILKYGIPFVSKIPFLKRIALRILNKFPSIKQRVRKFAISPAYQYSKNSYYSPINEYDNVDFSCLSPFALDIYYNMKRQIKNKENS
ncbi:hypothetical protein [Musicola paradisiaca]|uniref:Uncharacterized protein n=1 Tax=Musicola paradisiaca (strain Ech703) TaxID=579405 RepID=C6CDH0_MUSP7|nr:hypothetical protein [Musicola paradisiaca]ACS87041.1 hypothetical protein Dd703_3279 [Musicola paradisiaca Ech703]